MGTARGVGPVHARGEELGEELRAGRFPAARAGCGKFQERAPELTALDCEGGDTSLFRQAEDVVPAFSVKGGFGAGHHDEGVVLFMAVLHADAAARAVRRADLQAVAEGGGLPAEGGNGRKAFGRAGRLFFRQQRGAQDGVGQTKAHRLLCRQRSALHRGTRTAMLRFSQAVSPMSMLPSS